MRYYFYNSFTLGCGYKYAELKNNTIQSVDLPTDIDCDFSNGGCKLMLRGTSSGTCFLMVKGIYYVNKKKRFDEQGRKVYINFAVEADRQEGDKLSNVFYAIIAEWNNVCQYLGDMVAIPYPSEGYGYGIDQNKLEHLLDWLSEYDSSSIKSKLRISSDLYNTIILKTNEIDGYKSLAYDLYKSKKHKFSFDYNKSNIVTGDSFTQITNDLFSQNPQKQSKEDYSASEAYATFCSLLYGWTREDCTDKNDVGEVGLPKEDTEIKDQTLNVEEESDENPQLIEVNEERPDETDDKSIDTSSIVLRENEGHQNTGNNINDVVKKYAIPFVCGLVIGYIVGKYL